ncbi:type IV conjugative transfer system protein TraE [Candidatus Manganitrophus noduliformans]|uniref:Pilus assembly protein n=1 Tax=Candidatus Manganitrophus noduliformans TaxID=2606439 RepID=A0A7X6DQ31_9BACT|nr:type IV conjugative transfer system protein TraE [Candidatus Manganitrophus noduliformans]NKE71281.1 pilus assembly protein [Candidatus Manganitrophus noduliformans]
MKLETYLQGASNKAAENRLLKSVVLIIGVAVVVNTVLLSRAMNAARTILIPPGINGKVEITGDRASEEYVKAFARYVTGLAGSYTPATARAQFEELLVLYSPEAYPEGKKIFYELADRIETAHVTHVYFIQKIAVGKSQIEVSGIRKQFIEATRIDETGMSYLIDYKILDGRFTLLGFSEKTER